MPGSEPGSEPALPAVPPGGSGPVPAVPPGGGAVPGGGAGPLGPAGPAGAPEATDWHRLHPLSPVVRLGGAFAIVAVLLLERLAQHGSGSGVLIEAAVLGAGVLAAVIRWLVTRWRIDGGALRVETGLLRRQSLRLPLAQLQAVDIVQPGLARVLGLSELRLRMAGSSSAAARLAYLPAAEAELLRARLLALAHGLHADAPAPPERVLLGIPTGRLVGSLAIGSPGLLLAGWLLAVGLVAALAPPGVAAPLASSTAWVPLGAATAGWRRLNAGFELTLAESPDGLRTRAGLLSQVSETIPRGRIQAARLSQPLSWRLLGWWRLELEVAGSAYESRGARNQRRSLRAILPVGTADEAAGLLGLVFPSSPQPASPPPARARLKSPLTFHWLGVGLDDRYAVTSGGRLRHVVYVVPLAKVQSLRFVEGPLQRRLRLGSVHLDTPGRRGTHAVVRDRDAAEVARLSEELPRRCAAARRLDRPVRGVQL